MAHVLKIHPYFALGKLAPKKLIKKLVIDRLLTDNNSPYYHECDSVFRWNDGRPFLPDYVSDKFPKLPKANGMPHICFHELRHSAASNLLNIGFSLNDVQEWLGHSDIKTTANTYGHLDANRKLSMAKALVS